MTEAELKAIWTRYMHRADLSADLDHVFLMASTSVSQRMERMVQWQDALADDSAARLFQHAGLVYLHELAQDDEGQAREVQHFNNAASDYAIWKSRQDNPTVDPFTYARAR